MVEVGFDLTQIGESTLGELGLNRAVGIGEAREVGQWGLEGRGRGRVELNGLVGE